MASDKFRQELREESRRWQAEGLISAELQALLVQRYGLDRLEKEASSQFLNILLGLGGILLGLGAITFVAANWQGMSPLVKVVLLLSSLIGINAAGFSLWNNPASIAKQRWGHALLLLGVLLLGANIGLLPQIFHQSGPVYGLFLVWGLGVLGMAAGLRLGSLAVASLILLMISFFSFDRYGIADIDGVMGLGEAAIVFMPLLLLCWLIPLAHWCRSQWLFALSAIALSITVFCNVFIFSRGSWLPAWLSLAIGLFLPAALLWSYDASAWRFSFKPSAAKAPLQVQAQAQIQSRARQSRRTQYQARFKAIARSLSLFALTVGLYSLSFHGLWDSSDLIRGWSYGWNNSVGVNWLWLLDEAVLAVLTLLGWSAILRRWPGLRQLQLRSLNSGLVALLIAVPVGLLGWVGIVGSLPVIAPFAVNILLALMAIGLIRDGLALGTRSYFWLGMVLLVLDIVTRTFEYNAGLMVKALAFMLCGIGVLVAGLWFERKSAKRTVSPATAT